MNNESIISEELLASQKVLSDFLASSESITKIGSAADLIVGSIRGGGKIMTCGNGGSHCDAMHFAEELTGRFREDRRALPAIAIQDPSHMSCVSNDFGFEEVFSRYIQALGKEGDVLVGISTSGNSPNVIRAFEEAKKLKMHTVALTGNTGGNLASIADIEIRVPHHGYSDRIQEVHIKIIHILILLIEKQLS